MKKELEEGERLLRILEAIQGQPASKYIDSDRLLQCSERLVFSVFDHAEKAVNLMVSEDAAHREQRVTAEKDRELAEAREEETTRLRDEQFEKDSAQRAERMAAGLT